MATAAERWRARQTRRLARDAASLAAQFSRLSAGVDRFPGPYGDEALDLSRRALDLVRLAASVDGMQEITDLMTEETG